jgi:hypothetical protein
VVECLSNKSKALSSTLVLTKRKKYSNLLNVFERNVWNIYFYTCFILVSSWQHQVSLRSIVLWLLMLAPLCRIQDHLLVLWKKQSHDQSEVILWKVLGLHLKNLANLDFWFFCFSQIHCQESDCKFFSSSSTWVIGRKANFIWPLPQIFA